MTTTGGIQREQEKGPQINKKTSQPFSSLPNLQKKSCFVTLFGHMRGRLGKTFHDLAPHKECWIEEGHIMPDHVHMLLNVPPKIAVSSVVGYIKGKSAIHIARHFMKRERNYEPGRCSGHEGILWIRWDEIPKRSGGISPTKKKRTKGSTNWRCLGLKRKPTQTRKTNEQY
jgi:putative transposase